MIQNVGASWLLNFSLGTVKFICEFMLHAENFIPRGGLGQFCSSFISRANDVICRLQLVGQAFWFSVIHYGNGYSAAYTFPSTETKPQNMCWWDAHMIAKWMEKPRKKKIILIQVLGGSISMAMRIYVAQALTLDFKKSQGSTFLFTRSVRFM